MLNYRIAGNFWGRKLSQISRISQFCSYLQKFSPWNLGAWCPLVRHKWAIRESFLHENVFFTNSRKFSPSKVSRYTVCTENFIDLLGTTPITLVMYWQFISSSGTKSPRLLVYCSGNRNTEIYHDNSRVSFVTGEGEIFLLPSPTPQTV